MKELRQRKTNIIRYHLYVESEKKNKLVNTTKMRLTDIENKRVVTSGEREVGRSKIGIED